MPKGTIEIVNHRKMLVVNRAKEGDIARGNMEYYESPRNGSIMDEEGPITVSLTSGHETHETLAKYYGEDLAPITYASQALAQAQADSLGLGWAVWPVPFSRRYYVVRT